MKKIVAFALLMTVSMGAAAGSFWLVGSFPDKSSAMDEAMRISAETETEVFVHSGGKRHRLMIALMSNDVGRKAMRAKLAKAGISNLFVLNYGANTPQMQSVYAEPINDDDMGTDELAEIDAMLKQYDDELDDLDRSLLGEDLGGPAVNYVVAASFQDAMKAEAFALGVVAAEYDVTVRSANVNGTDYYRVLVGPVAAADEVDLMRRLAEQGNTGVWVLRGVPGPSSSQLYDISTPPQGFKIPSQQQRRTAPRRQPGEDSDFNLATLKKKPE